MGALKDCIERFADIVGDTHNRMNKTPQEQPGFRGHLAEPTIWFGQFHSCARCASDFVVMSPWDTGHLELSRDRLLSWRSVATPTENFLGSEKTALKRLTHLGNRNDEEKPAVSVLAVRFQSLDNKNRRRTARLTMQRTVVPNVESNLLVFVMSLLVRIFMWVATIGATMVAIAKCNANAIANTNARKSGSSGGSNNSFLVVVHAWPSQASSQLR